MESHPSHQRNYTLHFNEIPSLNAQHRNAVIYWVNDSQAQDVEMFWNFIHDNEPPPPGEGNIALTWWDICIEYRDADDSKKTELVRLCYDFQSHVLRSSAVPYTERGFKRPGRR
jgi:hypothetical protein